MSEEPLLALRNVSVILDRRLLLEDISLHVNRGEITGVVGRNGAGKSTLLRVALGLQQTSGGEVRFAGEAITGLTRAERALKGMGSPITDSPIGSDMTPEGVLLSECSVNDQFTPDQAKAHIGALLSAHGLSTKKGVVSRLLTLGELRRLEICRVMIRRPSIIFLDEPFAMLEPRECEVVQTIIRALPRYGTSVVLADHNVWSTLEICERAYVLNEGRVATEGTAAELRRVQGC